MASHFFVMFVPQGVQVQLNIPEITAVSLNQKDCITAIQKSDTPFGVTVDIEDPDEKILPYISEMLKGIRSAVENVRSNDSRIIQPSDLKKGIIQ
jgi:hypothetical protein